MKSVGQTLKQKRLKQKKTILQIHKETKIPEKSLRALEADDYHLLPPATFVKGFIQAYAKNLELDADKLIAIFRRDWQKKEKTQIIPPELKIPSLTPKLTTILIAFTLGTIFLTYLGLQIKKFFSPPTLLIEKPLDNEKVTGKTITIGGKTTKESSVYINDELINIDEKGQFSYEVNLTAGENQIIIKAVNRRGRETIINRKVQVVDKNP